MSKTRQYRRAGIVLMLVVLALAVVGGLAGLLGAGAVEAMRSGQEDRAAVAARSAADSAVLYARAHRREWLASSPTGPIELAIGDLLPTGWSGSARLTFEDGERGAICRVEARVQRRDGGHTERRVVQLGGGG